MRTMISIRVVVVLAAVTLLLPDLTASAKPGAAERGPQLSGSIETLSALRQDTPGEAQAARLRCTSPTSSAGKILSDCAFVLVAPHNEPHIAVNPTNANNLVAGANG